MTPDFRELVGDEGSPQEVERLRRVHELLIAAGPPPPESSVLEPPKVEGVVVRLGTRRRLQAGLAFAAALIFAAFAVGYLVGGRGGGFEAARVISMEGVAPLSNASAELSIGVKDSQGNIPLEMSVQGLRPLPAGGWYELYLSKHGRPVLSCGTFRADSDTTTVHLTIGYELQPWGERFDGWVVTAHVPGRRPSENRVLLTT